MLQAARNIATPIVGRVTVALLNLRTAAAGKENPQLPSLNLTVPTSRYVVYSIIGNCGSRDVRREPLQYQTHPKSAKHAKLKN